MNMNNEIKIDKKTQKDLKKYIENNLDTIESFELPKYASQFFNIISSNAGATRSKYVGQMSEIVPKFIKEFYIENNKFPNWKDWEIYYLKNYEKNYNDGLSRLKEYLNKHIETMQKIIDNKDELAKIWYDKFLMLQNFQGFQYEEIIYWYLIKKNKFGKKPYKIRRSNPEEESKGIDIIIEKENKNNKIYINVKPTSFYLIENSKNISLNKKIITIFYEKKHNGEISISFINEEEKNKLLNF
ncbi:MAG: type II restriction endonuclease MjaI [Candidatus Tyloplasma litorale]|nr:MAG: type II restriction endonuclease MjaI [Mycoplasmatales bacterium]